MDHSMGPPPFLPPIFSARRRVIIACTNCRKRKIRCITTEDPPQTPCNRCAKKNLQCEYITIANQRDGASTNQEEESRRSESGPPPAGSLQGHYPNASRPIDNQWGGNSRREQWTAQGPPLAQQPISSSRDRFQPYRSPSGAYTSNVGYNGAYATPNLPLTMQPDPYFYSSMQRRGHDARVAPILDAQALYGPPQSQRPRYVDKECPKFLM
ncbi:hypothetical protein K438DRAFT_1977603 [Mycena galopus ATCC 62051]|nr:hypothetical protein K438DRAFT_2002815 [Mycena galopus ATCC 62051]KAF8178765.1 hypothetical protein K438DRAFT_1977603 [Mycena galopus ATCC 62051]